MVACAHALARRCRGQQPEPLAVRRTVGVDYFLQLLTDVPYDNPRAREVELTESRPFWVNLIVCFEVEARGAKADITNTRRAKQREGFESTPWTPNPTGH